MKHAIRTFALACAMVVIAAPRPAFAQTGSIKTEMLKDWSDLKDTMMKIANAMPADKYNFKPTPAQQDFGTRTLHVAQVNVRFLGLLGGKATPPALTATMTSKEASMKAMADSFDYGTAILNEQTDATMLQTVKAMFMGDATRARMYTFLIGHTWDIYGQMVVYLRLNGGVPPASQRP